MAAIMTTDTIADARANLDAMRAMMQEAQEAVMRRNCENEKILFDVKQEHAKIETSFFNLGAEREVITDHIATEIRKDEEQVQRQLERERVLDALLSGFGVGDGDPLGMASTCDGGSRCESLAGTGFASTLQEDSVGFGDEPDGTDWAVLEKTLDGSLEAARSQLSSPLVRPQSTRSTLKPKQLVEEEEEVPSLSQLLDGLVRDTKHEAEEQPPLSGLAGLVRSSVPAIGPSSPSRAPVDKRVASPAGGGLRSNEAARSTAASPQSQMTLDKLAASQPQFGGDVRRSGSGTRQSQSPAGNSVEKQIRASAAAKAKAFARGRGPPPALPSSLPRGLL